jgi:hypothetical protein
MPLVKKQSGWFWGSKGPFSTKAKALAVARAAYASGYKGESIEQQYRNVLKQELDLQKNIQKSNADF